MSTNGANGIANGVKPSPDAQAERIQRLEEAVEKLSG